MTRALLVAAACLTLACGDANRVEIGRPAPDYSAVTLAGDSVSLASQRGSVVLLNVWATWCHPCRTEIPELLALYHKYRDRGFTVIGVSIDVDGSDEAVRDFMTEFKMDFPVWRDTQERVLNTFLALGVPSTYLIDKHGILRWRKLGQIAPGDTSLAGAIEKALQ